MATFENALKIIASIDKSVVLPEWAGYFERYEGVLALLSK